MSEQLMKPNTRLQLRRQQEVRRTSNRGEILQKSEQLMKPNTRLELRRQLEVRRAQLQARKMDFFIKTKPEFAKLRNVNIQKLLYYGDILFKNVTSTSEHAVPSTALGSQDLPGSTRRLDLKLDPIPDDETGACKPVQRCRVDQIQPKQTSGCGSTSGGKQKSFEVEQSDGWENDEVCKRETHFPPPLSSCMPFLKELMEYNSDLAMYGSTLLGCNERYREIFSCWDTATTKVEWLLYMERKGYR